MRLIDAELTLKLMGHWADKETNDDIRHGYHNCQVIVSDMPTAGVMCEDCKYWKKIDDPTLSHLTFCTYALGATVCRNPYDFCSRGEKADESH